MNNNKRRADISSQESWASNISDYILLRRQQTYLAYNVTDAKPNTDTDSAKIDKTPDSGLFTALFTMLATHLEEGHTVLTIQETEHEVPLSGHINGELVTLYAWQQQLLEMLATPIIALIDTQIEVQSETDITAKASIFVLLETLFAKQDQLWAQLALSNHDKEMLVKRFDAVALLYKLLKNSNMTSFAKLIDEHTLFASVNANVNNNKNSLSKNNQPIIYQLINNKEADKQNAAITFWLHRAWQAEFNLAERINTILDQQVTPLEIAIPENLHEHQIKAINVANNNAFSIITGGPGTGKTTPLLS